MDDETKPKRESPIPWRPPAGRRAEFDAMVAEAGTSRNQLITQRVFGRLGGTFADVKRTIALFLPQLAKLNDRLHDIGLSGSASDCAVLLEEIRDLLIEIRSALFQLLRRKP
ncbi:MAG: hypothetical protein H6907_10010 [Hyphomicrobiales bacterium]|nr:hypothetical protein [Hyphomicrobiales bacterium]MCP5372053.1 hypothetical protein [Hyphomicrobiales bacterium]